jgi:hypothetical protein
MHYAVKLTRQHAAKDNRKSAELILSQCLSDWRKKAVGVEFVVPKIRNSNSEP